MRQILFSSILLIFNAAIHAQQLPYYRNEIYAPHWHNPASYGTWNTFSVNLQAQEYSLFTDTRYGSGLLNAEGFVSTGKSNSGLGLGALYMYDYFNIQQSHSASIKFNYQFALDKLNISVGFAPGFRTTRQNISFSSVDSLPDPNAPLNGTQTKANFDAGIFMYTDKFYVGISSSQLNRAYYDELIYQTAIHYFFNTGYRFKVANNIQLFPSAMYGYDGSVQHLTTTFLLQFMKPAITLGFGYGVRRHIRALVGYEFKGISFLYSIGTNLSLLTNANLYYQEIRISYKLKKETRCSTCEYF